MNEKQSELTMEALRAAVAEELLRMKPTESEEEPAEAEQPQPKESEEIVRVSFFRQAETLTQLVEEVNALRDTVEGLERELAKLRKELDEERQRSHTAERELRQENRALREAVAELRNTDALIHMRVFDNRVRISEVREALEEAKA